MVLQISAPLVVGVLTWFVFSAVTNQVPFTTPSYLPVLAVEALVLGAASPLPPLLTGLLLTFTYTGVAYIQNWIAPFDYDLPGFLVPNLILSAAFGIVITVPALAGFLLRLLVLRLIRRGRTGA
jgi:hypothetical protein